MNKKTIKEFVGNVVILVIVIAVTNLLNQNEMNCRTLVIDAIVVLVGAGLMTGLQYLLDKKKSDK